MSNMASKIKASIDAKTKGGNSASPAAEPAPAPAETPSSAVEPAAGSSQPATPPATPQEIELELVPGQPVRLSQAEVQRLAAAGANAEKAQQEAQALSTQAQQALDFVQALNDPKQMHAALASVYEHHGLPVPGQAPPAEADGGDGWGDPDGTQSTPPAAAPSVDRELARRLEALEQETAHRQQRELLLEHQGRLKEALDAMPALSGPENAEARGLVADLAKNLLQGPNNPAGMTTDAKLAVMTAFQRVQKVQGAATPDPNLATVRPSSGGGGTDLAAANANQPLSAAELKRAALGAGGASEAIMARFRQRMGS